MALSDAQHIPRATYRVQLHGGFPFADLERRLPYLKALGISDAYLSPILLAIPGSSHGYDVADYRKINPELGGESALARLMATCDAHALGVVIDFVANHMGISGPFNGWWMHVLECGQASPYARFFDVRWRSGEDWEQQRILVPVLENHYGVVLESGGLRIRFSETGFFVFYGALQFPLNVGAYSTILRGLLAEGACPVAARPAMAALTQSFDGLGPLGLRAGPNPAALAQFAAMKENLVRRLAEDADLRRSLDVHLEALNGRPGDPATFDALDRILESQHYRLARWRTGIYAVNYRRFFAIDTLVGLRMENFEVFRESHALLALLLECRAVTGLRIDHIDGLWDPQQYLEWLQALARPGKGAQPLYVVIEKILTGAETLPPDWSTHGTTGYEFIAQCSRLFTQESAEAGFTDIYRDFTGEAQSFADLRLEKKRFVLGEMFTNTLTQLAGGLFRLLATDRRWRDVTQRELTVALREIIACFPVYRTYRRAGAPCSDRDRRTIETACALAVKRNPLLDLEPFFLVRDALTGAYPPAEAPAERRQLLERWALGFQQYTGAVMAKSVEDTAFFLYNRLIALNEVGGSPAQFGGTIHAFHDANQQRRQQSPHALIATATHDTKLSEDARARLYALSELPDEWRAWLAEWREINRAKKSEVGRVLAPDSNEEYLLYQALLGVWPLDEGPSTELAERIRQYFRKAVNEAKLNTTWTQPNDAWLAAGDRFIDGLLQPDEGRAFLASFGPKAARLAHLGSINSLAQIVLKLTSPGVPDIYQGSEIWEFSLVDPDNRRPVDFDYRERLLAGVGQRTPLDLMRNWRDGGIKLRVIRDLLNFRNGHAALFAEGDYAALETRGSSADHAVCFRRASPGEMLLVVVPRQTARIGCPPLGLVWEDTVVAGVGGTGEWLDLVTGHRMPGDSVLRLADLFAELPFAVLYGATG